MKHKEIYRPYWGDIAKHPEAKQIPFYLNRCHTARPVCPFCVTIDCEEHEYRTEYHDGYGYSTYPPACEGEHNYVFTGQYVHGYGGKYCRVFSCVTCEDQIMINPDNMTEWCRSERAKLPLIELLDPYGDLLDDTPERATPVLDMLRGLNTMTASEALQAHSREYSSEI